MRDYSPDVFKSDLPPLDHVDQTTWGRDQEMTSSLEVTDLTLDVGSTVYHAGTYMGAVRELQWVVSKMTDQLVSG